MTVRRKWGSRLCEVLDIKYPIIQGGMANISEEILAAAVTNAGGLGVIAAGGHSGEGLRGIIQRYRSLCTGPCCVNMMVRDPKFPEWAAVCIEEGVNIVALGTLTMETIVFQQFLDAGIKIMALAGSPKLAVAYVLAGADVIVAEGMEAAGHIGDETSMVLIPAIAAAVREHGNETVPVVGAGGVANGFSGAAMAALGCDGIQAGTIFLYADECQIAEEAKAFLAKQRSRCTLVSVSPLGISVRVCKNRFAKKYVRASDEEKDAMGSGALFRAMIQGDVNNGSIMAGQVAAYISELKPAAQIVEELYNDTHERLWQLGYPE